MSAIAIESPKSNIYLQREILVRLHKADALVVIIHVLIFLGNNREWRATCALTDSVVLAES